MVDIIATLTIDKEKASAVGVFISIPTKNKIATEILARVNLLSVLTSFT